MNDEEINIKKAIADLFNNMTVHKKIVIITFIIFIISILLHIIINVNVISYILMIIAFTIQFIDMIRG